jgi:RimJ/RimL family protein N-acetyltransferase
MHNIFQARLVRLRGLRMEDAETMAMFPPDTEAEAFSWHIPLPLGRTPEHEREWLHNTITFTKNPTNDDCKLGIETANAARRLVGNVGLHNTNGRMRTADLSIWLSSNERHKGYGTEAILLMLNYAFNELDYQRVGLQVVEPNVNAYKLYKKLGFVEEGRLRRAFYYRGQHHNTIIMSLLKEEFIAAHREFIKQLYTDR